MHRQPRASRAGTRIAKRALIRPAVLAGGLLLALAGPADATSSVGGDRLDDPGVVIELGPGSLAPAATEAAAYVVADLETGAVLAAKSAHERLPPASTLKVLTALTLLPELDKAEVVVGTDEEVMVEGSKVGIAAGLSYSVDLLFKAMLIDSGNDAAQALARANGGVEHTVASMNATARELHALDTVAVNPSGLDEPGQLTSAYDLALIARAALERDDFRTYVTTPTADLPAQDGTTYQIQNGNRLLGSYDGLIGVKTGFTTLARHTYVAAAERDGRAFLVTVMRTEGRGEAVAATLLDWAFLNADAVEPVGALVEAEPFPVVSAAPESVAGPPGEPGASAAPGAVPAATAGGGLGALATLGLVVVGVGAAVVGLRLRAVRRERLRRERIASPRQRSETAGRRA